MERVEGIILIKPTDVIENIKGLHDNCKVKIDEEIGYFKSSPSMDNAYLEVFTSYLALGLGINSVKYDFAYKNKIGVFSKDFNPKQGKTISLSAILNKYNEEVLHDDNHNLSNLPTIKEALDYYYKDIDTNNIMASLVDTYIFQALVGNIDVLNDNLLIFADTKELAPNFDYSATNMISYDFNIGEFGLGTIQNLNKNSNYNPKEDLNNFFKNAPLKYQERFINLLAKIDENFLEETALNISLDTNFKNGNSYQENITTYLLDNVTSLKNIIYSNRKSAT